VDVNLLENSEDSLKKQPSEMNATENPPAPSSNPVDRIAEVAFLTVALDETGSFRICTPPEFAKELVSVLNKLPERDRELWTRRFTPSCTDRILNAPTVDEATKRFFGEVARKLKDL
jgi:hypothetical protein